MRNLGTSVIFLTAAVVADDLDDASVAGVDIGRDDFVSIAQKLSHRAGSGTHFENRLTDAGSNLIE